MFRVSLWNSINVEGLLFFNPLSVSTMIARTFSFNSTRRLGRLGQLGRLLRSTVVVDSARRPRRRAVHRSWPTDAPWDVPTDVDPDPFPRDIRLGGIVWHARASRHGKRVEVSIDRRDRLLPWPASAALDLDLDRQRVLRVQLGCENTAPAPANGAAPVPANGAAPAPASLAEVTASLRAAVIGGTLDIGLERGPPGADAVVVGGTGLVRAERAEEVDVVRGKHGAEGWVDPNTLDVKP